MDVLEEKVDESDEIEVGKEAVSNVSDGERNADFLAVSRNSHELSAENSSVPLSNNVLSAPGNSSCASSSELQSIRASENDNITGSYFIFKKRGKELTISVYRLTENAVTNASNNSDNPEDYFQPRYLLSNDVPTEECIICRDEKEVTIIIPCGHLCCYDCCARVATRGATACPICRNSIDDWQKIYTINDSCRKCGTKEEIVVLIPCGDMCLCHSCSVRAPRCPLCKCLVRKRQKVFRL